MTQQKLSVLVGELSTVKPGDPVLAQQWNRMIDAIKQLLLLLHQGTDGKPCADVMLGELLEDAIPGSKDFEIQELRYNAYDDELETVNVKYEKTFEPQNGLWLDGERVPFLWDTATSKYGILPMLQTHIGKMDGELVAGGMATMSVWQLSDADVWEDAGVNLYVYDWLLKPGSVIAAGAKVMVVQLLQSRRWIVYAAECP